jgi:hypothetical protein
MVAAAIDGRMTEAAAQKSRAMAHREA